MTNYVVKGSNHGYAMINVAWNDECIVVRGFDEYYGDVDSNRVINSPDITQDVTMYPFESLFQYNSKWYFLQSSFKIRRDYGQLQGSGTYVIYRIRDKLNMYAMRLDAEKYPDLVVNDWRWLENRGYGAILKFCLHYDDQDFANVPKVYYLRGPDSSSTVFVTQDVISGQPTSDGQTHIVPDFTYQVNGNQVNIICNDSQVRGLFHIEHRRNVVVDDYVPVEQLQTTISYSKVDSSKSASFDVLYGFTRLFTIEV